MSNVLLTAFVSPPLEIRTYSASVNHNIVVSTWTAFMSIAKHSIAVCIINSGLIFCDM